MRVHFISIFAVFIFIGHADIVPESGVLVNGECTGLSPLTTSTVGIDLKVTKKCCFWLKFNI